MAAEDQPSFNMDAYIQDWHNSTYGHVEPVNSDQPSFNMDDYIQDWQNSTYGHDEPEGIDQEPDKEPSHMGMIFWWVNYTLGREHRRLNPSPHPMPPKLSPSTEYDIIVSVYLHGEITTQVMTEYKPNFANATILEATTCGVGNFCQPAFSNKTIQTAIDRYRKDPSFVDKLQHELVKEREAHIQEYEAKPTLIPEKLKPAYEIYKTIEPWRIIEKGYLEREYTSDANLNKIVVQYASHGPFKVHENLYANFDVRTRTELMDLLQASGYVKPLILDFSCGVFKGNVFDRETCAALQEQRVKLGVGGTRRKRTTRRKRFRKQTRKPNKIRTRV